jgi:hypothetical protein
MMLVMLGYVSNGLVGLYHNEKLGWSFATISYDMDTDPGLENPFA